MKQEINLRKYMETREMMQQLLFIKIKVEETMIKSKELDKERINHLTPNNQPKNE